MSMNFAPQQFLPYENFTLGFRMKYPADWWKDDQVGVPIVCFSSPPESPTDMFRENLTVTVDELAPGQTFQEYIDQSINACRMMMPNFSVIASQSGTLSSLPAFEMLFTWTG